MNFSNPSKWPPILISETRKLIADRLRLDPDNTTEKESLASIDAEAEKARQAEAEKAKKKGENKK